jgi:hypothetical protein
MRRSFTIPDDTIRFERSPQDKGLLCPLTLGIYDNGLWKLNGKVIAGGPLELGWLLMATVQAMEREAQS